VELTLPVTSAPSSVAVAVATAATGASLVPVMVMVRGVAAGGTLVVGDGEAGHHLQFFAFSE
jgi:hypothetical protein